MLLVPFQLHRSAGSTLVDVMFAISLVAFASAALFLLHSNALQLIQSQQETQAATLCLQERVEQLRGSNWDALTSVAGLQAMLRTVPTATGLLPAPIEEITVSAYPPPSPLKTLQVRKLATGALSTITQTATLASAGAVRADVRTTWTRRGKTHVRENSIIIPQGGLVR